MYAIIMTSGRQYRVEPGTVLTVDRLAGNVGDLVPLENSVLMASTGEELKVGAPTLAGAKVECEILEHFRGPKLIVFKMKRRKRYRRKHGHRQELTRVTVKTITVD